MKRLCFGLSALAVAAVAGGASAGSARVAVNGLNNDFVIHSADLSGFVFGQGNNAPNFTTTVLAGIHGHIAANNSQGISTSGFITYILAETSHGLSFVSLVDNETNQGPANLNASLFMTANVSDGVDAWINDTNSDNIAVNLNDPINHATGTFGWDSNNHGDGFAWSGLTKDDVITQQFGGATGTATGFDVQFLSWDESAGEWTRVYLGDDVFANGGQFGFVVTIIPLPGAAVMGLAGLAGLGILRRRVLA